MDYGRRHEEGNIESDLSEKTETEMGKTIMPNPNQELSDHTRGMDYVRRLDYARGQAYGRRQEEGNFESDVLEKPRTEMGKAIMPNAEQEMSEHTRGMDYGRRLDYGRGKEEGKRMRWQET